MAATGQPREYLSSRRRHVPSLHGEGTTGEPTFWNVRAARESHLDDDASASFAKDTLPYLGQNHAVGRIGRGPRGPQASTEQKNENCEKRAASRESIQLRHYCGFSERSSFTAATSGIISSARRALASISRASMGMDV